MSTKTETDICPQCNGSGEGMHDGSICTRCRGSGVVEFEIDFEVGEDEDE